MHSPIGASSYHRWKECPGSVRLSEGLKSVPSIHADEGTRAHAVAADMLLGKQPTAPVPDGMLDAVMVYVQEIHRAKDAEPDTQMWVEHSFDLGNLYPNLYGTADCVLYFPRSKRLQVYDYKHGSGVFVDAQDNLQLQYYALGAVLTLNLIVEEVQLVIVQPRFDHPSGPVRRCDLDILVLMDFAADLVAAARRTSESDAFLAVGPHCRWCPAAGICPEAHERSLALAQSEFSPVPADQGGHYDPARLAHALSQLHVVEAWVKSVRDFAYREAMGGNPPPGYKLVAKRASRQWAAPDDEIAERLLHKFALRDGEVFDRTLKSPSKIEKLLPKKVRTLHNLDDLITSRSSGVVLVPEADKRPAVVYADPSEEFKENPYEGDEYSFLFN